MSFAWPRRWRALSAAGERTLDEFGGHFAVMLRDWERWIDGAVAPETR